MRGCVNLEVNILRAELRLLPSAGCVTGHLNALFTRFLVRSLPAPPAPGFLAAVQPLRAIVLFQSHKERSLQTRAAVLKPRCGSRCLRSTRLPPICSALHLLAAAISCSLLIDTEGLCSLLSFQWASEGRRNKKHMCIFSLKLLSLLSHSGNTGMSKSLKLHQLCQCGRIVFASFPHSL